MISDDIKELFEKLTPMEQRICLQELEDEFDITINFDLITALKQKVKTLELENGKMQSYIDELESQIKQGPQKVKMTIDEIYASIPKAERQEFKQRLATAFMYRNLAMLGHKASQELHEVRQKNERLTQQVVQLSMQLSKLKNSLPQE